MERFGILTSSISGLLSQSLDISVLLLSIYLYMKGELTLGQVFALSGLVHGMVGPVMALINQYQTINHVKVSMDRIDDIITSAPESNPKTNAYQSLKLKGEIEFKNISFQYGNEMSPMVLDDVSLKIFAGETVALVGGSGSGKTTLGKMVNLLYAPVKGKVFVDGIDASTIPLEVLRSEVAMIMQENALFSGTVIENITLGDPLPSFTRAMDAARNADAHNFIAALPEGYSTLLGENGEGLSGGQKQRINIARAFYRSPSVMILDEATSALDAVSEQAIMSNIKGRTVKKTTVIIAHRLNTIMHADRIVALKNGKVLEVGTHKELMAKQGYYYDLFRKQLNL
jgi:ABC-type bacteriocin/lantibiotic exporter with double-glycine peptidase domain